MDRRTAYPNRKISETFLHFAAFILHNLPSEATEHRAQQALQVSFTAWNAVVLRMCSTTIGIWTDSMPHGRQTETALLMEQLIARKRALFADDERIDGDLGSNADKEDGINLRADARDPRSLPRDPI